MQEASPGPLRSIIMDYIDLAIWRDYLICILITSAAEGALPSMGIDYGVGKSTLMMYIPYLFVLRYGKDGDGKPLATYDQYGQLDQILNEQEAWNQVFSMLHTMPWELEDFFYNSPRRYFGQPVFFLYDDMQRTLGKARSRDAYVRTLKERITTSRTQLAVFIGSAPDIGELAYPFRYLFNFEIIVPQRGKFEIQRIKKWKPFWAPYTTQVSMPKQFASKSSDNLKFPPLPYPDVQNRYNDWREEANKRFDEGEGEWRLRSIRNVLPDEATQLLHLLIEKGSLSRTHIVANLDQGMELKLLKNCGMIEIFSETVVPTRQARQMIKLLIK